MKSLGIGSYGDSYPIIAAQDLSSKRYHAIRMVSGRALLANDVAPVIGILQDTPKLNEDASIIVEGFSKAYLGGTVSEGDVLSVDSMGQLIASNANPYAMALEDGSVGEVIDVLIRLSGFDSGGGAAGESYRHPQPVASTTWTVEHNFTEPAETVQIYVDDGLDQVPTLTEWVNTDSNTVTITFALAQSGYAIARKPNLP